MRGKDRGSCLESRWCGGESVMIDHAVGSLIDYGKLRRKIRFAGQIAAFLLDCLTGHWCILWPPD